MIRSSPPCTSATTRSSTLHIYDGTVTHRNYHESITLAGEGYEMTLSHTLKDDTISFTYNGGSEVQTFNYKIENNVLSIIAPEGSTITYTKK